MNYTTIQRAVGVWLLIFLNLAIVRAQNRYELNEGWVCAPKTEVSSTGQALSTYTKELSGFMPATVPGTVLTTLLNNGKVPDPFYGMNNLKIKDIYETGRDYYTYWFVKDFDESAAEGEQVWLTLRGINYSCEIYLNGQRVNPIVQKGMFMRQTFNITSLLSKEHNRLAVIVYPPDEVGNPNGGQGGDGTIAKNVSHQYVAGWDWIQPIRDRNTGIWDKVYIEKTGLVNLKNPHIVTKVPGKRYPKAKTQQPASLAVSAELENTSSKPVSGTLSYVIDSKTIKKDVTLPANSTTEIALPDATIENPKLWWPNMYGDQNLYDIELAFNIKKEVSDKEKVTFGVREIQTVWNTHTQSMQIQVNGQKIFIKGGNWIISDAMLRFTDTRYDAEIRYHRDMNLNLIRIWGGALAERPEFYQACDKYGMLVMQDFWMSGDCNGKWVDPMKLEDQWTRRQYPEDHALFLNSARDQIKMIRNHPSLALYCGGNEITPPEDILTPLRDEIIPQLDGTRYFFEYSNADSMSLNTIGGNGDGPYGIQDLAYFWENRTWPFNSEVGSVGVGDIESLKRFIPEENLVPPTFNDKVVDSVWDYHKYIGYGSHIRPYGDAKDAEDFGKKAQLVNYDQYRALMEGFSSHMWDWYTGTIIWKTQNPWTAMRGQMYDYYLDPNACLYGLRSGSEALHVAYNPVTGMISAINNTFEAVHDVMLRVETISMSGERKEFTQLFVGLEPTSVKPFLSAKRYLDKVAKEEGVFLLLQLLNAKQEILSENFYWIPDGNGEYSGLNKLPEVPVRTTAKNAGNGKITVTLENSEESPVAFFNRISLVNGKTKERILPVFYSDNYISVTAGHQKTITIEYDPALIKDASPVVTVEGWNVAKKEISIQ